MIDHSLVRPELSDQQVEEGCRIARQYHVASVSVRPSDLDLAVRTCFGAGPGKSTWR
jgi:deoxyribose-phosphate aldolase